MFFLGFRAIDGYGPKTEKKTQVHANFLILTSACMITSSPARSVPTGERYLVVTCLLYLSNRAYLLLDCVVKLLLKTVNSVS